MIRQTGFIIGLLLVWLRPAGSDAAEWELLPAACHDVDLSVTDDVIDIRTTGTDPFLMGRWRTPPLEMDRILQLEYFCPDGIDSFHAYHGPPISESRWSDRRSDRTS